jgi:hypothetical protein
MSYPLLIIGCGTATGNIDHATVRNIDCRRILFPLSLSLAIQNMQWGDEGLRRTPAIWSARLPTHRHVSRKCIIYVLLCSHEIANITLCEPFLEDIPMGWLLTKGFGDVIQVEGTY